MPKRKSFVGEVWRVIRFLLRKEPACVGTGLLFAVGLAMIYGDDFVLGIADLSLTAIWGIAAWLASGELQNRKPQAPTKQKYAKVQKYRHARRRYLFWKFVIPLGIVTALVLGLLFVDHKREEKILREYEGFLLPTDKPDPPSFRSEDTGPEFMRISKDSLKVFIGRNEAFASHFPFTVLRVRKKDRIIIDRDETGKIALSVDILDDEGRVIVMFEKGHFTVVQANILDMKRPDRSTLIVRDRYKKVALDIRYLNKRSLQFSGLLRYPEFGVISIPKSSAVNGICVGNVGGAAYAIE